MMKHGQEIFLGENVTELVYAFTCSRFKTRRGSSALESCPPLARRMASWCRSSTLQFPHLITMSPGTLPSPSLASQAYLIAELQRSTGAIKLVNTKIQRSRRGTQDRLKIFEDAMTSFSTHSVALAQTSLDDDMTVGGSICFHCYKVFNVGQNHIVMYFKDGDLLPSGAWAPRRRGTTNM